MSNVSEFDLAEDDAKLPEPKLVSAIMSDSSNNDNHHQGENDNINTYGDMEEYVPGEEEWDEFKKMRWDEGGRSDCGYSDTVHDTLMCLGGYVHSIFGEPSDTVQASMKGIGSYFQEAAYAARDYKRGTLSKGEIASVLRDNDFDDEQGLEDIDDLDDKEDTNAVSNTCE